MAKRILSKERLTDVLHQFDLAVALEVERGPKPSLVVVGGVALMLDGLTSRTVTKDIDIVEPSPVLYPVLDEFPEMNADSMVYLDCLPYNYEDRLVPLDLGLEAVDVFRPSLEDLAVMKLRGARGNDMQDITSPNLLAQLDWEMLAYLVHDPDEAKASCMSDLDYRMLLLRYADYEAEYRP